MNFEIDFDEPGIGRQSRSMPLANGAFVHDLCAARTFCCKSDVETMHRNGLALGGSVENAIVFDDGAVLSPGGLRHDDEPVRHKMLDAVGDLALAGSPLIAKYSGYKAGHTLTNMLLAELFSDPRNYRVLECDAAQLAALPGAGLKTGDLEDLPG